MYFISPIILYFIKKPIKNHCKYFKIVLNLFTVKTESKFQIILDQNHPYQIMGRRFIK